jgi:hypothetical protein
LTQHPINKIALQEAQMKNTTLAVSLVLALGLAAAGTAQAAGKIYIGGKVGYVDPDFGGFDSLINAGVYGGYNLLGKDAQFAADLHGGTLAVEGEGMLTISKGKAGALGKWDLTSLAAYAAYRHPLTDYFYLKAKAGLVRYDINTTYSGANSGTDTKLAAGVGAGWKVGPGSLEAEVVTYEGDILQLSAGFHMSF